MSRGKGSVRGGSGGEGDGGGDPAGGPAPGSPAAGSGAPGPGDLRSGGNTAHGEDAGQRADIERLDAGNVPTHADPASAPGQAGDPGAGNVPDPAAVGNVSDGGAGGGDEGKGSGPGTASGPRGRIGAILALPNDDPKKTVAVALALCLVCSVVVSAAAVLLRPAQDANAELDRKKNILEVAGLLETERDADTDPDAAGEVDVEALFGNIERRIVDLEKGEFTDAIDPDTFDARVAAADPEMGILIDADKDIAGIGRRARYAEVYLIRDGDALEQIVLPVHGLGLWSTLYGFIALEGDLKTISGLKFYDHAETPGLGGEVDNVAWRRKWQGKVAFDDSGDVAIEVIKGTVPASAPDAAYSVDGLAGATLTSRGVTNLLRYWLDDEGFGTFLANFGANTAARAVPARPDTEGV